MSRTRTIQIQALTSPETCGGGAAHARGLARGLRALGQRVSLLCPHELADAAVEFDDVRVCRPRRLPLVWRWPALDAVTAWGASVRRATCGVDAIIALSPALAAATCWARPATPRIYAPAALLAFPGCCASTADAVEDAALHSGGVLFSTPGVGAAFTRVYGLEGVPISICPLGVDADRLHRVQRLRASLGVPPGARLVLTVGTIDENKGQRIIAAALNAAARADWWWAVVGTGPGAAALEDELRRTGLAPRCRLIGSDRHVADWYAAADVLVSASRCETFGLAVAEALAAGCPVVVPRDEPGRVLSPLAAAVTACGLGRTFAHGSPGDLARTLAGILDDDAGRWAAGRRAALLAPQFFSWERYAACALRLLAGSTEVHVPWDSAALPGNSGVLLPPARPRAPRLVATVGESDDVARGC